MTTYELVADLPLTIDEYALEGLSRQPHDLDQREEPERFEHARRLEPGPAN